MNPKSLQKLLETAFRTRQKVLIVGKPGEGKSEIVQAAAARAGAELVTMQPAVSDPTDFKGMPATLNGVAEFLPFGDLRKLIQADKLTVCFLDDIGQAPPAVQAALMHPLQAREINGQKISDHVVFCGATNDSSHMAGVQSILEPVKSRWDTIVKLESDVESWVAWAMTHQVPAALVAFIRFRPAMLSDFKPTRELVNSPSPRTVTAVGRWLAAGVTDHEVIAGAAGEGFAAELRGFLRTWKSLPSFEDIENHPLTACVPTETSAIYATVVGLAYRANPSNFSAIFSYASRLPKEFEILLGRDIATAKPEIKTHPAFTKFALANSHLFLDAA